MSRRGAVLVAGVALAALALVLSRQARAAQLAQVGGQPDSAVDLWAYEYDAGWDELPGPVGDAGEDAIAGEYATESDGEAADPVIDEYVLPVAYQIGGWFMAGQQQISLAGLDAIRRHEGFSATPYRDAAGYWTIGYGHKIKAGEDFASVTEAQAVTLLAKDVAAAERAVNALVKVALTQPQFDALVSFVYNVGTGAFRNSTLLRLLNQGQYAQVPAQLARWRYVTREGRKVELAGLATRRAQEGALFASGTGGTYA